VLTALTVAMAAGVAAGYFAIAALIVPRIRLENATPRFVTAFRVGGVAFFVGCGLTHTHIAYHALVDEDRVETHELIFHLLQVFGVWVFVYAALRFLDVRVVRRKTPQEHDAEALQERISTLSRSNADLEQFAHVVAHDLQEPLRSIAGFADLLRRRQDGSLDPGAAECLDFIDDGTRRMDEMLDGILSYSRVAGVGLRRERVDMNDVVRAAVDDLARGLDEAGAEVEVEPLPEVVGDAVQLRQLVQNLLANAIRFRGEEPLRLTVSAADHAGWWRFDVRDNGTGIDPGDAERIFLMFARGAGRDTAGTGLGLALCRKIVARHGGTIWVEPAEDGGARFSFTLPRQVTVTEPLLPGSATPSARA
jgi:signal transduction histidine kinase